jgi:hypothetical protein
VFERIIPLGRDTVEVEGRHPNPLIGWSARASEVYSLVEPGQRIAFTVEGGKSNIWSTCTRAIDAVTAETAAA